MVSWHVESGINYFSKWKSLTSFCCVLCWCDAFIHFLVWLDPLQLSQEVKILYDSLSVCGTVYFRGIENMTRRKERTMILMGCVFSSPPFLSSIHMPGFFKLSDYKKSGVHMVAYNKVLVFIIIQHPVVLLQHVWAFSTRDNFTKG